MNKNTQEIHKLYHAAIDADEAWQAELTRLFGKNAGDIRYTAKGKGAFGTKLNQLYLAWLQANAQWIEASSLDAYKI